MKKIRVIALLSGGGTTLQNIIDLSETGALPVEVVHVIASRSDAYGLERAKKHNIPATLVASKEYRRAGRTDWDAMSARLDEIILPLNPDLICFCGFMCFYKIPASLQGKVMNVHPALIPAFCGQGMCGHAVHEAAVANGVKVSGCTVHFVTNEYDAGPIIVQRVCPVYDTDNPDTLAERVMAQERIAYPQAIRLFAEGRLTIEGNRVRIAASPAEGPDGIWE